MNTKEPTNASDRPSADATFTCERCGYELRSQPVDGKCPECGHFQSHWARRDSQAHVRRLIQVLCRFAALMVLVHAIVHLSPFWYSGVFDILTGVHGMTHRWLASTPFIIWIPVSMVLWFHSDRLARWAVPVDARPAQQTWPNVRAIGRIVLVFFGLYLIATGFRMGIGQRLHTALIGWMWHPLAVPGLRIAAGVVLLLGAGVFARMFQWTRASLT